MNRYDQQEPNYLEEPRQGGGTNFFDEEKSGKGGLSSSSNLFLERSKDFFEKFQEKTKFNPQRALVPAAAGRNLQESKTPASPAVQSRFPSFTDPLSMMTSETGRNTLRQAINSNPGALNNQISPRRSSSQEDKQGGSNGGYSAALNSMKSNMDKIFQVNSSRPNPKDNPRSFAQQGRVPEPRMELEQDRVSQGKSFQQAWVIQI